MTLNAGFSGCAFAALLAGAFFLFNANLQRDAALVQLREARQVAGQLRAQLVSSKIRALPR